MAKERKRPIRIVFYLNEQEQALLEEKMEEANIQNREAYIRKMVLDGYVIKMDFTDVKRMIWLLSNATNNLNQVAKRANETRSVAIADIQALHEDYQKLWRMAREIARMLAKPHSGS